VLLSKKMARLKIYVFRHGQSTFNRDGKFTGLIDAPLTFKGRRDAKAIAQKLKAKKFEAAFETSLKRSKDTLKEVLRFHPECTSVMEDDRMTERSYGGLSGKSHDEIIKKYGQEKYDDWHRGFDARPPKGESFADVEKRVKRFIRDLRVFMKKNRVNVAISAHGNSVRLFRKIMENAGKKEAVKWVIPYDNYYEYGVEL